MSRSVDWVEQDLNTGALLWRQGKRETGQFPVTYTDRRVDHQVQVQTKKATKKKLAEWESRPRYTEAQQKQLAALFEPVIKTLKSRYGNFSWWHYDFPTGTLLYGSGAQRVQVQANDVIKLADQAFEKFSKQLSKLHGHAIVPARSA